MKLRMLLFAAMIICGLGWTTLAVAMEDQTLEHVVVYYEPGRYAAWPANEGIWSWGNEIVVGFNLGYYNATPVGTMHFQDTSRPLGTVQARSLDGGVTWTLEMLNERWSGSEHPSIKGIDFAHPDFAMKLRKDQFWVSYDRARTWHGPYSLPKWSEMTALQRYQARTNYVGGSDQLVVAITATKSDGSEGRPLLARLAGDGKVWEFLGWITPEPPLDSGFPAYSIMPAIVRLSDTDLLTVVRMRYNKDRWLEVLRSNDNGLTWESDGTVSVGADNPASLVLLDDGRLVVTYGYRGRGMGVRAKISVDGGRTWGDEIILRDDPVNSDLGYVRSVQRPDGKVVTIYYYNTADRPEQHIAATIWTP